MIFSSILKGTDKFLSNSETDSNRFDSLFNKRFVPVIVDLPIAAAARMDKMGNKSGASVKSKSKGFLDIPFETLMIQLIVN